jgi:nitrite reductase (cytochrome c-552)
MMSSQNSGQSKVLLLAFGAALVATVVVTWVLVTMVERKQEARTAFPRIAELSEISTDPAPWGQNWPHQYEAYLSTAGDRFYGGSSALTASKLDQSPWLRRLFAGYAFSIDYREARGHSYMLYDQGVTERVTKKPQAGACLHCHAANTVMYRKAGLTAMGLPTDDEALKASFNVEAVSRGFKEVSRLPYSEVLALLQHAPDGTNGDQQTPFPQPPVGGFEGEFAGRPVEDRHQSVGDAHPVSCIDCHDPKTMSLRVTRPGFMIGIAELAESDAATPHLPSIERWRRGDRALAYDANKDASGQEMRSYVCGQCHVEYYCGNKDVLTYPWGNGLRMEQAEAYWDEKKFPDGSDFYDYEHGETGARVYKVQHPEFELWSAGIHARSGVTCADCHMPYQRVGAMKVSSHAVASPMEDVSAACRTCHHLTEAELEERVETIQARTTELLDRTAGAMTDMLDAILEAKAAGASEDELSAVFGLQRKAMWRLDYVASENSRGFHAPQESARILGESIDYSRQAQAMALRLRAPQAPPTDELPIEPVSGVTANRPPRQ